MGLFTTTSTTFAVGDEYTATWQNTYVKGLIDGFGAGSTYTSSWTGTSNPSNPNGSTTAAYTQIGKLVYFRIKIVIGATGFTAGTGQYSLTLPVTPTSAAGRVVFTGWLAAGSAYPIYGIANNSTTLNLYYMATLPSLSTFTGTAPVTLAASHEITIHGCYEAA